MNSTRVLLTTIVLSLFTSSNLIANDKVDLKKLDAATLRARANQLEKLSPEWLEALKARGIPGMTVVVVQGDELIYSKTLGERTPETNKPITMDTMFYIASCTKSYMAMGIMSLIEQGKVELDAPVKKYLPRFKLADAAYTESLTVRDLLSHDKGLNAGETVFLDAYTGEITEDRYYYWLAQATPTGKHRYTNVHYTLLGRIAEAVTGQTWKEFLKNRIFDPSGMYHTTPYASIMYGSDNAAVPSEHDGTKVVPCKVRKNDSVMHAAGGLGTSGNDLVQWLRLNLGGGTIDGQRIVTEKTIAAMHKLQSEGELSANLDRGVIDRNGYGFGWFVGSYRDIPIVDHGGGYVGTSVTISFMPQQKLGVAVMTNGSSSLAERVALTVYDELLGIKQGSSMKDLIASCKRQHARVKKWNKMYARRPIEQRRLSLPMDEYVGSYYQEHWGTIFVTKNNDRLNISLGSLPTQVKAANKDSFEMSRRIGSSDLARFVVNDSGAVIEIIVDEDDDPVTYKKQ